MKRPQTGHSRQVLLAVIVVGLCWGLASCYPTKRTYFTPTASSGRTVPIDCANRIGDRGSIVFALEGVRLEVRLDSTWKKPLVEVVVQVRKPQEVAFDAASFAVSSTQGTHSGVPRRVYETEGLGFAQQTRLIPYEPGLRLHAGRHYSFSFADLPLSEEQFTFSVPALMTGTGRLEIPVITFTKITEWRLEMVVLNC